MTGLGSEHVGQKHRIKHVGAAVSDNSCLMEVEMRLLGRVVRVGTVGTWSENSTQSMNLRCVRIFHTYNCCTRDERGW